MVNVKLIIGKFVSNRYDLLQVEQVTTFKKKMLELKLPRLIVLELVWHLLPIRNVDVDSYNNVMIQDGTTCNYCGEVISTNFSYELFLPDLYCQRCMEPLFYFV